MRLENLREPCYLERTGPAVPVRAAAGAGSESLYAVRVDGVTVSDRLTLDQARAVAHTLARVDRQIAGAEVAFSLGLPLSVATRYLFAERH